MRQEDFLSDELQPIPWTFDGTNKPGAIEAGSVRSEAERFELIARLDAAVSLLFGLSMEDVRLIFETFHRGWDYEERLAAVQRYMKDIQ